jgi:hypothetical protein
MNRFPLFKISFNNKSSLILGTNHFCPLYTINNNIKDLILNKKNIIVENNILQNKCKEPLKKYNPLENFNKLNYFGININENQHIRKNILNQNIIKFADCKILNNILSKINHENFLNTFVNHKIEDFNSDFVSEIILITFFENGLDNKLMSYYSFKKVKIYGLDNINDNKYLEAVKLLRKENKKKIIKLIYKYTFYKHKDFENYINDFYSNLWKDYLKCDFNILKEKFNMEKIPNDNYLLGERNDIWLPKIINYHNQLEDSLFVFGYGHLCGEYDLFKKLKYKIGYFNLEIYDINKNNFVNYDI